MRTSSPLPPIFGRDVELAAIRQLVADLDGGVAGLVLSGPPGIGKSRLWLEAVHSARASDVRTLVSRPADADATAAFTGLRDLLTESAPDVLDELPALQRDALAVALLLAEPRDAALDPHVVSASVLSAPRVLASGGPLLVALDDVQWLDASSRAALAFALRRCDDGERVGLLATVRSERGVDVGDLVDALPRDAVRRHAVRAVTAGVLRRIVLDRCGVVLDRSTLLRLHDMCGGNPYLGLELARGLGDGRDLTVPRELADILGARLATLSAGAKDVVLIVALLSRPTVELVARLTTTTDTALDEAVARDVLEVSGGAVRFVHPLLASVLLESTPSAVQRTLHARLAAAVDSAEERVRHLARASPGPDERVAGALDDAAGSAARRGAPAAAAELAAMAVSMTPLEHHCRARRVLSAAEAAFASGDNAGADGLLADALSTETDDLHRAALFLLRGRVGYQADHMVAADSLRAALALAGGDRRLRVQALLELAANEYVRDGAKALAIAMEAEQLAEEVGDEQLLAQAIGGVAFFEASETGRVPRDRFRRAVALEEKAGPSTAEWSAALDFAQVLLDAQDLDPAREIFERAVARCRADGHAMLSELLDNLAFVELHAGRLDLAADLAREAVESAAQTGRETTEVYAQFRLGWIEGLRGNVDAARDACARSLRLAAHTNGFTRGARLSLGYLESSLEHYDAAWRWLDPTDPATGEANPKRPVVPMAEVIEVLTGLGRTSEARARLEPFAARAAEVQRAWAIARAAHCRVLVLAADDDLEGAARAGTEAIRLAEQVGFPVPLGRALLAHGMTLRRARRKADARSSLQRALALFESSGARIWRDRANRELGRIGGRSAPAGDELSTTEMDIARLVAGGSSNKQVAAALHISAKTVEWNLSKIYRKLDVHSRTELARRVR